MASMAVRARKERRPDSPESSRSARNRSQGQNPITAVWGKNNHGVMANENAKATEPKSDEAFDTPSSESQSHMPKSATKSFIAARRLNACESGRRSMPSVNGENGLD